MQPALSAFLDEADGLQLDPIDWGLAVARCGFNRIDGSESLDDASKRGVLTIQGRRRSRADEERGRGASGVVATGHRDNPLHMFRVAELRSLRVDERLLPLGQRYGSAAE